MEKIKNLLKTLTIKERNVIILLFGFDYGYFRTPEEIGAMYGVDKKEILNIADQALSKIPMPIEELKVIAKKLMKN